MSHPPKIDGTIDPAEWQEALAVSGIGGAFDNQLYARPTTFYLGWDPGHLYMAVRVWVKPGYKPAVSGREPHSAVVYEDAGEFNFQPLGNNVPAGRTNSCYKFILNTMGYDGDLMRIAVGQQFRNWLPNFVAASRLTPPGSAPLGGRWLEIEWSSTPQDFELNGPHRAGDQWRMMLGFDHMYAGWSQGRIPCTSSYFDPSGYCLATLVDNTPGVQELMETLPGVQDGVAAVTFRTFNPTAQPAQLDVLAQYCEITDTNVDNKPVRTETELLAKTQPLTVAPGKSAEFTLNEQLPRLPKALGSIYYRVTQGNRELFRYYIYFKPDYPKEALAPAAPPTRAFPLSGTFNPVRSTLMLTADAYYLDDPGNATSVRYEVTRNGETKPVAEGVIAHPITDYFRKLIQLPPLAAGDYTVNAWLDTDPGKALGPEKTTFTKLDEARAFPEWWNTTLGTTERVIAPFIPMTRRGNTVTLWGREYRLDPLGLPVALVSHGAPVSAAPAQVVAVIDGKEQRIPLEGAPTFTETKDWRVSFTGTAKGAGLLFTARGSVEQDGLALIELTYAPAGKAPVTLDALRLEFPIAGQEAECLLCQGSGGNYAARTTLVLPLDKPGRLWSTFDTGKNGSGMTVGTFYPEVWLGSDQRGLLWYADNDRGWVPDEVTPAHEVIRRGEQVILCNNLIGSRYTLKRAAHGDLQLSRHPLPPAVEGMAGDVQCRGRHLQRPAQKGQGQQDRPGCGRVGVADAAFAPSGRMERHVAGVQEERRRARARAAADRSALRPSLDVRAYLAAVDGLR